MWTWHPGSQIRWGALHGGTAELYVLSVPAFVSGNYDCADDVVLYPIRDGLQTRWIRSRENNRGNEDGKQREYPGGGKPSSIISYLCREVKAVRGVSPLSRGETAFVESPDAGNRSQPTDYAAAGAAGSRD